MPHAAVDDQGVDILLSLAKKSGNDVRERALELTQKGQAAAEWGQSKKNEIMERMDSALPVVDELKAALVNQDPIDTASLANDTRFLGGYIHASFALAAFSIGETIGKWFGSLLIGLFLSNLVSWISIFIVLPAVYTSLKLSNPPPTPEDLQMYELATSVTIGILHGFNLSGYPAVSLLPMAIQPIIQSLCLHFIGPSLGNDRMVVVGVMASGWLAPFVLLGLILGAFSFAVLIFWILVAGGSAAMFQLAVARREGKLAALEGLGDLAIVLGAVIAETLVSVLFMKTYAQLYEESKSAPPPDPNEPR